MLYDAPVVWQLLPFGGEPCNDCIERWPQRDFDRTERVLESLPSWHRYPRRGCSEHSHRLAGLVRTGPGPVIISANGMCLIPAASARRTFLSHFRTPTLRCNSISWMELLTLAVCTLCISACLSLSARLRTLQEWPIAQSKRKNPVATVTWCNSRLGRQLRCRQFPHEL
jgi:hypothetical protein